MKLIIKTTTLLFAAVLIACGGGQEESKTTAKQVKRRTPSQKTATAETTESASDVKASERIDLENKGVGPIQSLELPAEIDQTMADKGLEVFMSKCSACHKADKRFIGPAPAGILKRRSPEWVMNMILNPDEMVKEDPLAKELLMEFNGSPMANQNLTEEEARAVLEYFRTL